MLPKSFFENHFTEAIDENLFVAMTSDEADEIKIDMIRKVATENLGINNFRDVVYIKVDIMTNDITYKIFDAIVHSKTLLFDLSDDPRLQNREDKLAAKINPNVMYELGIALSIRDPNSIILIREKSDGLYEKLPFDIMGIGIQLYDDFNEFFLKNLLIKQEKEKQLFNEKTMRGISDSIDEIGYIIINWAIEQPEEKNYFNISGMTDFVKTKDFYNTITKEKMEYKLSDEAIRMSIYRLMDLGILTKKTKYLANDFEHAYYWTRFGKEILKYVKEKQQIG